MTASVPLVMSVLIVSAALMVAYLDFRYRRIPNWITLPLWVLGLLLGVAAGGAGGFLRALAGTMLAMLIYMPLYLVRGMAAGDVKLMAALGACLGPQGWLGVFVHTVLIAGLFSLAFLAWKRGLGRTLRNLGYLLWELAHFRPPYMKYEQLDVRQDKGVRLPHGVFISAGCVTFLLFGWRLLHWAA